ncbi:hypothetical protein PanWU01x14_067450 [Parasponia andersonii]|uniref:Secreted protein n=1 Tax=Parasponia andersonii TaxID=3476 RepID=A0A2P5DGB1_PARAD|nr:hypothetical protein PanWU01x14_067450 [Parasponia andersonii]
MIRVRPASQANWMLFLSAIASATSASQESLDEELQGSHEKRPFSILMTPLIYTRLSIEDMVMSVLSLKNEYSSGIHRWQDDDNEDSFNRLWSSKNSVCFFWSVTAITETGVSRLV